MFRDGRTVPNGSTLDTDVCIVGGGVAGLILGRALSGHGFRLCIVESGGREEDSATQDLARGAVVGEPTNEPITTRQRQLGGTANLWDSELSADGGTFGFRSGPLDPIDFERRDAVPDSGWPFDRAHVDPYYERAQSICGFGPYAYRGADWASERAPLLPLDETVIDTTVWQYGGREPFLRQYPSELEAASDVTVLLHSNVIEVETDSSGTSVCGVRVATLGGHGFAVRAHVVILATGGLENPRLLLLSDRVQKDGLGNDRGLVGRYFMDHPSVRVGTLVPFDRGVFDRAALFDVRDQHGTTVLGKLGLTQETLRREGLLNSCLLLLPAHGMHKPEAIESLKTLFASVVRGRRPNRPGRHLREVAQGLDFVGVSILRKLTGRKTLFPHIDWGPGISQGGGWSSRPDNRRRYSVFDTYLLTEQPPYHYNRVRLGDDRDALGCRRLELDWRWDDVSRRSILRTERLLAEGIRASGFGRLRIRLDDGQPWLQYPGQHHHLGTTRMHADPARGVVDANARVHGIANLFVAGGSVFPTGGYINPTLTIAALALRLADHVRTQLERTICVTADAGGANLS
jgi:choline dehydrogenase-like flavoprotein